MLNAARLGSGGISIGVYYDSKQGLAQLRQDVSKAEKDLKATPKVNWDFQEAAVIRGVRAVINKIQREAASIDVAFRLKDAGLIEAAKKAGALSANQLAALSGGGVARIVQSGGLHNFDSMVGRPISDAGFSQSVGRLGRNSEMPAVEASAEIRSKAAIKAAHREYEEREKLEEKFAAKVASEKQDADSGGGSGGGGFKVSSLLRRGGQAFIFHEIAEAAFGVGGIAKGVGNAIVSNDVNNKRAGVVGAINSAESIPVLGTVISGFDKLAGITESLNAAMQLRVQNEQAVVTKAQLLGDPRDIARANVAFRATQMLRNSEHMMHPYANPAGFLSGIATGEMDEFLKNAKLNSEISDLEVRNATRIHRGSLQSYVTNEYVASLQRGLEPQRAERAALGGQWANAVLQAPDFLKDVMTRAADSQKATLEFQQRRGNSLAQFNRETGIGANQFAVRNFGMHLEDESAFKVIRDVQRDIQFSDKETIYDEKGRPINPREAMAVQGLSRLREAKAGLQVRGGGVVGGVNLATDLVGDPFNLMPQTQARIRAAEAIDNAMGNIGKEFPGAARLAFDKNGNALKDIDAMSRDDSGMRAKNLNAGYAGNDVTSLLVSVLQKLSDSLGKGGLLLPN